MAFTLDAVPTSAGMNSYVSIAAADDFFESKFGADAWAEFTDAVKSQLLASATRDLDVFEYGGLKTTKAQPLKWPRTGMYDNEGTAWPHLTVPVPVQYATCEQAYWIWTESERTVDNNVMKGFSDFKAGPLTLKMKAGYDVDVSEDALALLKSMGTGTVISTGSTGTSSMSMKL